MAATGAGNYSGFTQYRPQGRARTMRVDSSQ